MIEKRRFVTIIVAFGLLILVLVYILQIERLNKQDLISNLVQSFQNKLDESYHCENKNIIDMVENDTCLVADIKNNWLHKRLNPLGNYRSGHWLILLSIVFVEYHWSSWRANQRHLIRKHSSHIVLHSALLLDLLIFKIHLQNCPIGQPSTKKCFLGPVQLWPCHKSKEKLGEIRSLLVTLPGTLWIQIFFYLY